MLNLLTPILTISLGLARLQEVECFLSRNLSKGCCHSNFFPTTDLIAKTCGKEKVIEPAQTGASEKFVEPAQIGAPEKVVARDFKDHKEK